MAGDQDSAELGLPELRLSTGLQHAGRGKCVHRLHAFLTKDAILKAINLAVKSLFLPKNPSPNSVLNFPLFSLTFTCGAGTVV